MKAPLVLALLLLMAFAAWSWSRHQRHDRHVNDLWRDLRFRNPSAQRSTIEADLHQLQRLRDSRPADFQPALTQAIAHEWLAWRKQFDQGEADMARRLAWQGQTEARMQQFIREAHLDEAWLEHQINATTPPVSEGEVRTWFSQHVESLRLPMRHRVSHLFLSRHDPKRPDREAEIRDLHTQLNQDPDRWQHLVAQVSEDRRTRHRGGDLGWLSAERLPADFHQAVASLPVGVLSKPVQTRLGWHLLRVTDRQDTRLPTYEEAKDEIWAMLDLLRRETALDWHQKAASTSSEALTKQKIPGP